MAKSLTEIMAKEPIEEPTKPEPKAEQPDAKAEPEPKPDPKPEPEAKEAEAVAPEPEAEEKVKTVPHEALHAEREKAKADRKELETAKSELDLLKQQLRQIEPHLRAFAASQEQQPKAEEPKEADFFDDPAGYVDRRLSSLQNDTNKAVARAVFNLSEAQARARHEDYDDALQAFATQADKNPYLIQQLYSQVDPAEWAYQLGRRAKIMEATGDIADFEPRLREQIRKELMDSEEFRKEILEAITAAEPEPKPAPHLPKSLSTTRSAGKRTGPAWSGPTPLSEITAPRKRR